MKSEYLEYIYKNYPYYKIAGVWLVLEKDLTIIKDSFAITQPSPHKYARDANSSDGELSYSVRLSVNVRTCRNTLPDWHIFLVYHIFLDNVADYFILFNIKYDTMLWKKIKQYYTD